MKTDVYYDDDEFVTDPLDGFEIFDDYDEDEDED